MLKPAIIEEALRLDATLGKLSISRMTFVVNSAPQKVRMV
jgi:hypothetical protein